jgi:hypothetical protein
MKMQTLRLSSDLEEYKLVRMAGMTGRLEFEFIRKSDPMGEVEIHFFVPVKGEKRFFDQIEAVLDFGELTAPEVFLPQAADQLSGEC